MLSREHSAWLVGLLDSLEASPLALQLQCYVGTVTPYVYDNLSLGLRDLARVLRGGEFTDLFLADYA